MKDILLALMAALVHKKKISINFSKAKTKYCLSLHCNGGSSYLFVNGEEIKFKANNETSNF